MKTLSFLSGLLYPLLIYVGLRFLTPRALAGVVTVVLVMRVGRRFLRRDRPPLSPLLVLGGLVALVLGSAAVLNEGRFFLFVPSLINFALLIAFARTLGGGPSMIETLARLQYKRLAPGGSVYCRRVTLVWCGFFALNGAFILWLALWGSLASWTLYTGVLAYVLVGVILTVELVYRSWRFRHYEGAITDAFFRRIFPPRPIG